MTRSADTGRRRRRQTITRLLLMLGVSVALGMLAVGGYILYDLHRDAWRQSERASDNLILALARDITRTINVYDLSLLGARDVWSEPGLDLVSPKIRAMALFDRAASAEYLGSMLITDAQGNVVADSTSIVPHTLSLAKREHFLVHAKDANVGLFISRPILGRLRNEPMIAITRRLEKADGRFDGVVVGAMELNYFYDLFSKLDVGPKGTVTLFRDDGHIMMRVPFHEGDIDRDLGQNVSFKAYLKAPHGQLTLTASTDGIERFYTYHRLGNLPLILTVGVAVDDVFASWWPKAISIGSAMLVLSATTIALCLLFRREIQRRMAAEDAIVKAAEQLSVIASHDGLTGIPNRRSFDLALKEEWRRAIRGETPIALLMLDADCFKSYNDHYGHPAGDAVLVAIAKCIESGVRRPRDTAARYGGEEFVVLLPDSELTGAITIAEAILNAVAGLNMPHPWSPTGYVSISIGVAVMRPRVEESESLLLGQADAALYDAKRLGRNRLSTFTGPQVSEVFSDVGSFFAAASYK